MWLAKPVYEALPFCYIGSGCCALAASAWAENPYWSEGLFVAGLAGLVAGLVLLLKRRGYRGSRSRKRFEEAG